MSRRWEVSDAEWSVLEPIRRRDGRKRPCLVHEVSRRALGSLTTQDCPGTRVVVPVHVAFRTSVRRQHPDCVFSELNTQPTYPLFTLRLTPHGARRKTRGRAVR